MNGTLQNVHQLHQDDPFTMNYMDHAKRTDSKTYIQARAMLKEIVKTLNGDWFYGAGPYQDHHGGGLWVHDGDGWFMVKNLAGMEWASQFCADAAKVDLLRRNAQRLYAAFPNSRAEFVKLGFADFDAVLNTPIKDDAGVATWIDSIFNASVPLNQPRHTGVLPKGDGVHHYPTPVTDIDLFKTDDFQLWVTDAEGQPAAVAPVSHDPKDKRVRVLHSTPGTRLHAEHSQAVQQGDDLVKDENDPMSKAAFAERTRKQKADALKNGSTSTKRKPAAAAKPARKTATRKG